MGRALRRVIDMKFGVKRLRACVSVGHGKGAHVCAPGLSGGIFGEGRGWGGMGWNEIGWGEAGRGRAEWGGVGSGRVGWVVLGSVGVGWGGVGWSGGGSARTPCILQGWS